jgi:aspartyl-tRNA(Asn)/glutamyl-tRNA(Gln) amidotransferase subunit A
MESYMLTASESAQRIREGKLTPTKLAESLLKRIEELEPLLEAWVYINNNSVMESAERATKEADEGIFRSSLHGIPVGVKDIYYTSGIHTRMGSQIYNDFIPKQDSEMVKILNKAGMITLGKTETTEFAVHDPAPTRNPWNTEHTPGGSSSGSAAAVSSGMCQLAFGSQTGGSVLRPASYCGIIGVKPTYDLLSREGVFPVSWSLDHVGFFSRTIEDASQFLYVITNDKDSTERKKSFRLGLLAGYFKENASEQVWEGFEKSVSKLQGESIEIIDVTLPESFKIVHDVHRVIMSAEVASVHEDVFHENREKYREYLRGLITSGLLIPATSYIRANRIRGIILKDLLNLLKDFDCFITPSTLDTAPHGLNWTGNSAFNAPWSLSGLPSITVPSGLAENGLPLGLQLIGHPFKEKELLNLGSWCEAVLGFNHLPKDPFTP